MWPGVCCEWDTDVSVGHVMFFLKKKSCSQFVARHFIASEIMVFFNQQRSNSSGHYRVRVLVALLASVALLAWGLGCVRLHKFSNFKIFIGFQNFQNKNVFLKFGVFLPKKFPIKFQIVFEPKCVLGILNKWPFCPKQFLQNFFPSYLKKVHLSQYICS